MYKIKSIHRVKGVNPLRSIGYLYEIGVPGRDRSKLWALSLLASRPSCSAPRRASSMPGRPWLQGRIAPLGFLLPHHVFPPDDASLIDTGWYLAAAGRGRRICRGFAFSCLASPRLFGEPVRFRPCLLSRISVALSAAAIRKLNRFLARVFGRVRQSGIWSMVAITRFKSR